MKIGEIFIDVMEQLTDISSELAEWEKAIELLSKRANFWLTFSEVLAWAGCVLSIFALALLLEIRRGGGKHGKD